MPDATISAEQDILAAVLGEFQAVELGLGGFD
jgi:hypothetical protein